LIQQEEALYSHKRSDHFISMKEEGMQISAAKFKANCLGLMEDVRRTRKPVLITKRGRPIAQLTPVE